LKNAKEAKLLFFKVVDAGKTGNNYLIIKILEIGKKIIKK
jgi:hypothetical protein